MKNNLIIAGDYNTNFNAYLPYNIVSGIIYQSNGLINHIQKRHPECVQYMNLIPSIINSPDYIGVNPNEQGISFELIKVLSENNY